MALTNLLAANAFTAKVNRVDGTEIYSGDFDAGEIRTDNFTDSDTGIPFSISTEQFVPTVDFVVELIRDDFTATPVNLILRVIPVGVDLTTFVPSIFVNMQGAAPNAECFVNFEDRLSETVTVADDNNNYDLASIADLSSLSFPVEISANLAVSNSTSMIAPFTSPKPTPPGPTPSACFWTDFIGCAEDCSGEGPTPPNNRVAIFGYLSGSGDFPVDVKIYDTPFPQEGNFISAVSVPFTSGGVITEGHLYVQSSGGGCDWNELLPAANGEANLSPAFTAEGSFTFASIGTLAELADIDGVLTVPVAVSTDGTYVRSELYTACGIDPDAGNSFVFVGKVTNTATGLEYIGSGQQNTCF